MALPGKGTAAILPARGPAHQHRSDQRLPAGAREGYTLLLAMRSWEFRALAQLRR